MFNSLFFFFFEIPAVYEIMRIKYGRVIQAADDNTVWHMALHAG